MMPDAEVWGLISMIGADDLVVGTYVVQCQGRAALGAVDEVARLHLLAGRHGGRIVIEAASSFLLELFELSGLTVEVRGQAVEVRRQAEERKYRRRAQEEVEPEDPAL
jgi:hypothetical protein